MKILIIHPFFSPEGARGSEIIAQDSYKILKEAGYEVYYFGTNKQPYLENADWTKYFINYKQKFCPEYYWNFKAQQNIKKMLDDISPDIAHVHGTPILSYSVLKPVLNRKIPVVMTIHDPGIICPTRLGWDAKSNTICKKCNSINTTPCIINNCVQTKNLISSFNLAFANFLEKISGYNKKINRFITPSQVLADYVNCKDVPINKIKIIPNFLNNDFLKRVQLSKKQDYFLFVGTLADYKGVNILLEAIKELPKDIPFKIIGSGFQEDEYKRYAKDNNLNNIEFLGNLDREKIINYYQNCISLIVPSNYFEIFGMINIEAFACKRPVIASHIGGIPEIVENNKNGLLFEPDNVEQLKNCILKYWNNKDLAFEHGENGYQKVFEKYTEEKYYNSLIKIYEEVLNESRK